MAAKKYLSLSTAGDTIEIQGTIVSGGASSDGALVALNSAGQLDLTVLPPGVGIGSVAVLASEALAAGALVNIWSNASVPNARNADASAGVGKQAHGVVIASVASGATATVYLDNGTIISGFAGLVPGTTYFLSGTTPGANTATRPTTAAYISQAIGVALSSTTLKFDPKMPIVLA